MIFIFLQSCQKTFDGTSITDGRKQKISKLLSDEEFVKSPHILRNPETKCEMVVNGKGEILMKSLLPSQYENFGIIKNYKDVSNDYIYRIKNDKVIDIGTVSNLNYNTYFYDYKGNELNLRVKSYGARLAYGDKIFFNDYSKPVGDSTLYIYDVKEDNISKATHSEVDFFNNKLLLYEGMWTSKENKKEILVFDDDMQIEKRIADYSVNRKIDEKLLKILVVSKEKTNTIDEEQSEIEYNFLDENFDLILDEPVDNIAYENFPIVTLKRENKVYDFDLESKKIIGEVKEATINDRKKEEVNKKAYYEIASQIQASNDKYMYNSVGIHGDKVLIFVYYQDENDKATYRDHCDVYDINKNLLKEFKNVSNYYEDEGLFYADYNTIYDFDLNVVKKFDTDRVIDKIEKFGKVFYIDNFDSNFDQREDFCLYDEKFEVLIDGIDDFVGYVFSDKISIVTNQGTDLLDKNFSSAKHFDRKLRIDNWYPDANHYSFTDKDTNMMGVLDLDFNIVVDNLKTVSEMTDKYFVFVNGFKYGFMDYEGNILLDFSIFDSMRDDADPNDYYSD